MRMNLKRRAHLVTTLALSVVIGGGLFYISYATSSLPTKPTRSFKPVNSRKLTSTLPDRAFLALAGVGPTELAAAGVPASAIGPLVAEARQYIAGKRDAFATAEDGIGAAKAMLESVKAAVKAGTATTADLTAAQAGFNDATAARQAIIDDLFSHECSQLSADACTLLTAIRRNRPRGLPVPYLVVDREPQEWVTLRDALADAKIATAAGRLLSDSAYNVIASADGNSTVQSAKSSLDNTLSAVKQAFDQAFAS